MILVFFFLMLGISFQRIFFLNVFIWMIILILKGMKKFFLKLGQCCNCGWGFFLVLISFGWLEAWGILVFVLILLLYIFRMMGLFILVFLEEVFGRLLMMEFFGFLFLMINFFWLLVILKQILVILSVFMQLLVI